MKNDQHTAIKKRVSCLRMALLLLFSLSAATNFLCAGGIGDRDTNIEYTDLGTFQVGLAGQSTTIDVPYYKPAGIMQIPSQYFQAIVIHELTADGKSIKSQRLYPIWFMGADETSNRRHVADTTPEEKYFTLKLPWQWRSHILTNKAVKQGLYLPTYTNGARKYTIPYGAHEIALVYSIRFLIYGDNVGLIETIESEKWGVRWKLEWYLPE
jgi:hypothetical protein